MAGDLPFHHSYSRIYYFIIESRLLPSISNSQYHCIILSDHCPVQIDIIFPDNVAQWVRRLDPGLLLCKQFKLFIIEKMDPFKETNNTYTILQCSLGITESIYQGPVISYVTSRNRQCSKRLENLTHLI